MLMDLPIAEWNPMLVSAVLAVTAGIAGLLLNALIFFFLRRLAAQQETFFDDRLVRRWRGPCQALLPLLSIHLVWPSLNVAQAVQPVLRNVLSILVILALVWLMVNTVLGTRDLILKRYDLGTKDNLKARAIHTQLNVLAKVLVVVILVVGSATLLMTFEKVRQIGFNILASAGVIGVICGFAAQRSIATLFAGLQIAVTQPIRIDDVVIVEGEWGRIEEITLTYVVVRIWDQRRLVVPVTHFLEKPFQNWTRVSADILGTVFLYVDYRIPVDAIRKELQRYVQTLQEWDGRVAEIAVTGATAQAVELRALVSASDSGQAWTLRCAIRERLIDFVRKHYPESLPRVRAELHQAVATDQTPDRSPPAGPEKNT
jgi:small-conductance mechanosensitive channel